LKCADSCEVLRFGVKSIGSGVLFDFFDAFHIELSDISGGSTYFLTAAFLAKLVFAGLVLRIVTLYFSFRKRFRPVLRTSAMSFDEQRLKEALSKIDPKILGPTARMLSAPDQRRDGSSAPRNGKRTDLTKFTPGYSRAGLA
jgi:hypothetical protein